MKSAYLKIVGNIFFSFIITYGAQSLSRELIVETPQEFNEALQQYDRAVVMFGGDTDRFEDLSNKKRYENGEIAFIEYITQDNNAFALYKDGQKIVDVYNFTDLVDALEEYFGREIDTFIEKKEALLATIPVENRVYYSWPYYDYYYPWLNWYPVYDTFGFWPYFFGGYGFGRHGYNWHHRKFHRWSRGTAFAGRRGRIFRNRNNRPHRSLRPDPLNVRPQGRQRVNRSQTRVGTPSLGMRKERRANRIPLRTPSSTINSAVTPSISVKNSPVVAQSVSPRVATAPRSVATPRPASVRPASVSAAPARIATTVARPANRGLTVSRGAGMRSANARINTQGRSMSARPGSVASRPGSMSGRSASGGRANKR